MQDNSYLGYNFFFNVWRFTLLLWPLAHTKVRAVLWPVYKYRFSPLYLNLEELIKTQQHWSSYLATYAKIFFTYLKFLCCIYAYLFDPIKNFLAHHNYQVPLSRKLSSLNATFSFPSSITTILGWGKEFWAPLTRWVTLNFLKSLTILMEFK